ncbi:transmembrane emp24 domain-containing protein p24delta4-like [Solanum pennellii]|uniref:Transmembrane emp24 domain-containing protein p24delta4-like n=1 Tax=Solanum pennellii TaxID=28526 RepID=A0ABM1H1A6_SOLPN|nr:transmembrane emp24 domain-containing protein p24delta4-like [Solanum pennellii]
MKLMKVLKLILVVVTMAMTMAEALWLEMPSSGAKCVYEEIRNNVVVLVEYAIVGINEQNQYSFIHDLISLKVASPFGKILHHENNVTNGEFGFTTTEPGNYMACFFMNSQAPDGKVVHVGLDWKIGIAAKDWDSIARKEKIQDIELVLMKFQAWVQSIREKLIYMKKREEEMREVSERTNAAVAWFSGMSLSLCILAAATQIWYLKRFFRKKNLI